MATVTGTNGSSLFYCDDTGLHSVSLFSFPTGQMLNAMSFGADNTGNSDCFTAFQKISDAVNANLGSYTTTTVYFPPGVYQYSGGLNFTATVQLLGEPGTVLDYTGAAHAGDFGTEPSVIVGNDGRTVVWYVTGITFIGGSSMTEGLYFDVYAKNPRIRNCRFVNFGNASSWAIYFNSSGALGGVAEAVVEDCEFNSNDNTARNFCKTNAGGAGLRNSQIRAWRNQVAAYYPPDGATTAGCGFYVDGYGAQISQNSITYMQPAIHVGSNADDLIIRDNYFEAPRTGTPSVPAIIVYGDPTGGYAPSTFIDGLHVAQCHVDLHDNSNFLVPATSQTGLTNCLVEDVYCYSNGSTPHSGDLVVQNNNSNQTGNVYKNCLAASNGAYANPMIAYSPINTTGSNITAWQTWSLS